MEKHITFDVGEITLEGLLWVPSEPASTGVILCHPHPMYGGEMGNNVVAALAQAFQQAGLATLRFNFRGVGQSGGTHDEGEAELADVTGAITHLLINYPTPTLVVAGYSFGSMVGLHAGAADPRVGALIGVGTPVARIDPKILSTAAKPILLISGVSDHISPLDDLQTLVDKLPDPKQLVSLPDADHFLRGSEGAVSKAALAFIESLGSNSPRP